MRGSNPVRHAEARADGALQVHEVFYTVQGEGPHVGRPAVFVRLSGCNLRCWFCDTVWHDDKDPYVSPHDLARSVLLLAPGHCDLVVITGGEPMRQRLWPFVQELLLYDQRFLIQIETAGTYWQNELSNVALNIDIVVSPKTSKIHPQVHAHAAAFKYVISTTYLPDGDGLPMATTQRGNTPALSLAKPRPGAPVYLSPCDEGDPAKLRANMARVAQLAMAHGYRAGIQLHKVLGVP